MEKTDRDRFDEQLESLNDRINNIDKSKDALYGSIMTQLLQHANENENDIAEIKHIILEQYTKCPLNIEIKNIMDNIKRLENEQHELRSDMNKILLTVISILIGFVINIILKFVGR